MDEQKQPTACEMDAIRQDIRDLRRQTARIRRSCAVALAVVAACISVAAGVVPVRTSWDTHLSLKPDGLALNKQIVTQPVGQVIQVAEIQVLNANGQQVGIIGSDSAGDGIFLLADASGRPQAAVSVDANGAGIFTAFNTAGAQTVVVATDGSGDGFIGVGNAAGGLASTVGVGASGGGLVGVANSAGTGGATLGIDTLNVGRLSISNESGTDVVEAYAKGGNGQIEVKTSSGIKIWASDDPPPISQNPGDPSGLLGDLDNDGDVDFSDFLVFAQNFGKSIAG